MYQGTSPGTGRGVQSGSKSSTGRDPRSAVLLPLVELVSSAWTFSTAGVASDTRHMNWAIHRAPGNCIIDPTQQLTRICQTTLFRIPARPSLSDAVTSSDASTPQP